MKVAIVLALIVNLTSAVTPKIRGGLQHYEAFKVPPPLNISDSELKVKDFDSFVHHHGKKNGTALRMWPNYYDPNEMQIKLKILDLMKQAIYAAQDRMKTLEKIIDKYISDNTFRAGYVFSRLDQLVMDMKRIYSIAFNEHNEKRVKNNIIFYKHLAKKNIDITHIVEYMAAEHHQLMNP